MTDARKSWNEMGDHLSALALKLKLHAEEELSDEEIQRRCGFDKLGAAVSEAFDALEDAFEDEAVREDARDAGRAFLGALDATVREARQRVTGNRS